MNRFTAFLISFLVAGAAWAQAYPTRAVRVVVPWPPGQATDIAARVVAQKLQESLGQPLDAVAMIRARPGPLVPRPALHPHMAELAMAEPARRRSADDQPDSDPG